MVQSYSFNNIDGSTRMKSVDRTAPERDLDSLERDIERAWSSLLRVPGRRERDPDLEISAGLTAAQNLIAALRDARAQVAELREAAQAVIDDGQVGPGLYDTERLIEVLEATDHDG